MKPTPMLRALIAAIVVLLLVALIAALNATKARAESPKAVASAGSASEGDMDGTRCEYGITLAMTGEHKQAESIFVSLLSKYPGDPRALNNLGNLRVLDSDLEVALAFFNQAFEADPSDPGVRLNRATTFMLMGDVVRARTEASEAVKQAGGEEQAAKLIGLSTSAAGAEARGSDQPFVSKEEIRALLKAAKSRVPGDSLPAGGASDSTRTKAGNGRQAATWRSAGPRAGDTGDIATVLYWKK